MAQRKISAGHLKVCASFFSPGYDYPLKPFFLLLNIASLSPKKTAQNKVSSSYYVQLQVQDLQ